MSNLYPQPNASAAGSRTSYIMRQLAKNKTVWESVHFAVTSKESDSALVADLQNEGVQFHSIEPNNSNDMKALLDLIGINLSLVIYDKFYTEEMFSFHIHNLRPEAVQVVDMQDMHSLRRGRQALIVKQQQQQQQQQQKKILASATASNNNDDDDNWECLLHDSIAHTPDHANKLLLRELASLHRSDLSLVCSPTERTLLVERYQIPSSKLCTASFWVDIDNHDTTTTLSPSSPSSWKERHDFCFVGGFRHDPNVDAVQQLSHHIWPCIRKRLPDAQMHVYGAHVSNNAAMVQALHNPKQGFHIKGFTPDLEKTLSQYRVLLAPLRYGAGIKGKIVDAWKYGLPVVTTPIGSEGMLGGSASGLLQVEQNDENHKWGGTAFATSIPAFCDAAVKLHCQENEWNAAVQRGREILKELYSASSHWGKVAQSLEDAVQNRGKRRSTDIMRSLLWQEKTRSTEYFSRWIEAKNTTCSRNHHDQPSD